MLWGKQKLSVLVIIMGMICLWGCKQSAQQSNFPQKEQVEISQKTGEDVLEASVPELGKAKEKSKKKTENIQEAAPKKTEVGQEKKTEAGREDKKKKSKKRESEQENSFGESEQEEQKEQGKEEKAEYTDPVQALENAKVYYATLHLNVRKGPGTSYDVVGALNTGQEVEVIGITENGWYQILFQDKKYYASTRYLVETKEEVDRALQKAAAAKEADKNPTLLSQESNENQAAVVQVQEPGKNQAAVGGIIIIGDSRCVQMQEAVQGGGCSWICENAKGYGWLEEVAMGRADSSVGKGTKVVFCLGVNDPENVRKYAELVNAKGAEWRERGAIIYYVSVNPVWENPYVTKEEVENFNASMPGLLSGVIWIDTYTWLMENGCKIVDGLHYDAATSVNIFNLIIGAL